MLVVGLGKSGLSAARWLSKEGARVVVSDMKEEVELDAASLHEIREMGVKVETGGHRKETFLGPDMIIVSPGVPIDMAPLKAAIETDIPVLGEMELASQLIKTPLVAVTGTNGKSTTTALLGTMLRRAGLKVFVGGNIGTPLMEYAAGDLRADYAVVEVSSFQLDTMETLSPMISLVLNISPDHLDRYPDYESYVQSKLKILQNQGRGQYAILNDDDDVLSQFLPSGAVTVLRYALEGTERGQAFIEGTRLRAHLPLTDGYSFSLERFSLPGRHNLYNLMGAVLAGLILKLETSVIQETIDHFQGLPDRLEHVATIKGVHFYNDSKATNVDAAARSVASFHGSVILIAGGRHKGADYSPLVQVAKGRVKRAIFLGEARELLAKSFEKMIPFDLAEDMRDAIVQAFSSSEPNDIVLLAPACSSFDMYTDYAHRGRVFREEVERLAHGQ